MSRRSAADDLAVADADRRCASCVPRACPDPSVAGPDTLAARVRARNPCTTGPEGPYAASPSVPRRGPKGRFRVMSLGVPWRPRPAYAMSERRGVGTVNETQKATVAAHLEGVLAAQAGPGRRLRAARTDPPAQGAPAVRDRRRVRRVPLVPLRHRQPHPAPQPARATGWSSSRRHPGRSLVLLMVLMPLISGRSPHIIGPPGAGRGRPDRDPGPRRRRSTRSLRTLDVFLGLRDVPRRARRHPAARHPVRGTARAPARPTSPRRWPSRPACRSCSSRRRRCSRCGSAMTASRIRSFFKALRKAARKEGGAIGFIEEIDAIGGSRDGLGMSPAPGNLMDGLVAHRRRTRSRAAPAAW